MSFTTVQIRCSRSRHTHIYVILFTAYYTADIHWQCSKEAEVITYRWILAEAHLLAAQRQHINQLLTCSLLRTQPKI